MDRQTDAAEVTADKAFQLTQALLYA